MEYYKDTRETLRKTSCRLDANLIAKSAHLMQEKITIEDTVRRDV